MRSLENVLLTKVLNVYISTYSQVYITHSELINDSERWPVIHRSAWWSQVGNWSLFISDNSFGTQLVQRTRKSYEFKQKTKKKRIEIVSTPKGFFMYAFFWFLPLALKCQLGSTIKKLSNYMRTVANITTKKIWFTKIADVVEYFLLHNTYLMHHIITLPS